MSFAVNFHLFLLLFCFHVIQATFNTFIDTHLVGCFKAFAYELFGRLAFAMTEWILGTYLSIRISR